MILQAGLTLAESMALCDPAKQSSVPGPLKLSEEVRRGEPKPPPRVESKPPALDLMNAISADQRALVERSIYEMLCQQEPEMPDEQRRELAKTGAEHALALRAKEVAEGKDTPIYCTCTHLTSNHVGGVGRCKDPSCECTSAVPDQVRLEARR